MSDEPRTETSHEPRHHLGHEPGLEGTPPPTAEAGPDTTDSRLTGHPAVDEVLASLDDLESRPADEHVAVFESAHERLRAALSGAGDTPGPAASA